MNDAQTSVATRPDSSSALEPLSAEERGDIEQSLTRLDWLAELMDDKFELPIVRTKVGLDPIIGLIPGSGDWLTWIVSVYIFWEAAKIGAPKGLLIRMAAITIVDLIAGYVPAVGDLFDVAWKANRKNVEMLKDYYGASTGSEGTTLPTDLTEEALQEHRGSRLPRYALATLIILILLAFAAVPFVVLWWVLQQ